MRGLLIENHARDCIGYRMSIGEYFPGKLFFAAPDLTNDRNCFALRGKRNSLNFVHLLFDIVKLAFIVSFKDINIVLTWRHKSLLFGFVLKLIFPRLKVIHHVTGMGEMVNGYFVDSFKWRVFKRMILRVDGLIVQNKEDKLLFEEFYTGKIHFMTGSGIPCPSEAELSKIRSTFLQRAEDEQLNLLYLGRFLKKKGFEQFLELSKHPYINLRAIGGIDPENSDSLSAEELESLTAGTSIELHNFKNDLSEDWLWSDGVVLLSKYREGVPRVLIEALARGKFVVTKDAPGCSTVVTKPNYLVTDKCNVEQVLAAYTNLNRSDYFDSSLKLFLDRFERKIVLRDLNSFYETYL